VSFRKERGILEFFPIALYSIATIVRAGQSVEHGLYFVANHAFGRVSSLFRRVIETAQYQGLEAGLAAMANESENRHYRDGIVTLRQYARHGISVSDQLVAIGQKMQMEAVMTKRRHLTRVKDSLATQTTLLLAAIPFLLGIATILLTRQTPFQDEPLLGRSDMQGFIVLWLVVVSLIYPLLYRSYIFRNPAFTTPSLRELKQMFRTETDAFISRYLKAMAEQIEYGMSLEMAFSHAVPAGLLGGKSPEEQRLRRVILDISDSNAPFSTALHALSGAMASRKFNLTVEFIQMALQNKLMSVADMLNFLADSFWSSHITARHYQLDASYPALFSLALKGSALFFLAGLFPVFVSVFLAVFACDLVLMTLSLV